MTKDQFAVCALYAMKQTSSSLGLALEGETYSSTHDSIRSMIAAHEDCGAFAAHGGPTSVFDQLIARYMARR